MDASLAPQTRKWLDGWGEKLKQIMKNACGAGAGRSCPQPLLVGTDCSGLEAPIHALRGLGLVHQHVWSSEPWEPARRVIEANTMPSHSLFRSLLDQDEAPFVHLYVSGFSCKPFSLLHNQTKLLNETEAKLFYGVVERITSCRPPCFLLENVTGISRVKDEVLATLRKPGYLVAMLLMDPGDIGIPVCRPRLYIVGVRRDKAFVTEDQMQEMVVKVWAVVRNSSKMRGAGCPIDFKHLLLPENHPAVRRHQEQRKQRW